MEEGERARERLVLPGASEAEVFHRHACSGGRSGLAIVIDIAIVGDEFDVVVVVAAADIVVAAARVDELLDEPRDGRDGRVDRDPTWTPGCGCGCGCGCGVMHETRVMLDARAYVQAEERAGVVSREVVQVKADANAREWFTSGIKGESGTEEEGD